ncbi:hypothetical protein DFJ73DRAFT_462500 [Zopfochytrium polystomum]|nr:hypothetical protein DFJ73DRAFT_462500 [Zopfochytrium polystomum]
MSLSDADNLVRTIADPEDPFTSHTAGVALNRLLFDPPVKKPFPKCFRKVAMLFHRRLNERSFWTPPPLKSPVGISFGVSNILAATHDILKTLRLKIDEESTHWNVCALEWLKGWEQGDDGDADWLFTLSDLQLDGHVKTCAVVVVLDFFKLQERVNFTQREVERVTTSQASENNAPIAASEIGRKFCTKATEAALQINPLRLQSAQA